MNYAELKNWQETDQTDVNEDGKLAKGRIQQLPNNKKKNNKMSSDIGSLPGRKINEYQNLIRKADEAEQIYIIV